MSIHNIVVTVDDAHLTRIDAVAKKLQSQGLEVESVLQGVGVITGSTRKDPAALSRVAGVASVEETPDMRAL